MAVGFAIEEDLTDSYRAFLIWVGGKVATETTFTGDDALGAQEAFEAGFAAAQKGIEWVPVTDGDARS